jgi:hypothetical protein
MSKLQDRGIEVELKRNRMIFSSEETSDTWSDGMKMESSSHKSTDSSVIQRASDPISLFSSYFHDAAAGELFDMPPSTNEVSAQVEDANSNLDSNASVLKEQKLRKAILDEGLDVLKRTWSLSAVTEGAIKTKDVESFNDLRLHSVSLSNFGPYAGNNAVTYPLSQRGLVLLTGQSVDGTGADSNGAGKVRRIPSY